MRFVEKKCPNCGGPLKIVGNEAKCSYCAREFVIEDDGRFLDQTTHEMFDMTRKSFKVASFMFIVIFSIAVLFILFVMIMMFKSISTFGF